MGWKSIKEAFGIERHIVCVTEKGICIGSGYVHDLVTIDMQTGQVRESHSFKDFLGRTYPALAKAAPAEVLALIQAKDSFSASIPVFTYEGAVISERLCEKPGWPNATHCGELMYENTFHTDKQVVIGWAKKSARLRVRNAAECITRLREQLRDAERELTMARGAVVLLNSGYPGVGDESA